MRIFFREVVNKMTKKNVVIVGAGLAGLMTARTLKEQGMTDVKIVEKNNYVGGRLATMQTDQGAVDCGAQFFTAFTEPFQTYATNWVRNGWIKKWFGGTHPRYFSVGGMNTLAKHLAEEIDIELDTEVIHIEEQDEGYLIRTNNGDLLTRCLVITTPIPEAKQLVKDVAVCEDVLKQMNSIQFSPCVVAVAQLDKPSSIDALGFVDSKLPEGIERIIDNQKKGITKDSVLSIYMTGDWSKDHFEEDEETLKANIVEKLTDKLISDGNVLETELIKWRYSEATKVVHSLFLDANRTHPLLFAGDAFLAPKDPSMRARFESAALSGLASGRHLTKVLNNS